MNENDVQKISNRQMAVVKGAKSPISDAVKTVGKVRTFIRKVKGLISLIGRTIA